MRDRSGRQQPKLGRINLLRAALTASTLLVLSATSPLSAPDAQAINGGGQTLYVNKYSPNASSTPGCEPDAEPYAEIGSDFPAPTGAVGAARTGDTIFICGSPDADSNPYTPDGGVAGVPVGAKDLTFTGDGPELTIIDGQENRSPFYAFGDGDYLNFQSMTVRSGLDAVNGGGVEAPNRIVNIEDVTFINNRASGGDGGAIYAEEVEITDSVFIGNSASDGVAGAIAAVGKITVQGSTFNGNSAKIWGGALSAGGGVAISGSSFAENEATSSDGSGGAVYVQGGSSPSIVTGSTFADNAAGSFAGAVRSFGVVLIISNSTFTGNEAADAGAALSTVDNLNLDGVTFSGNEGPYALDAAGAGEVRIGNSIIDEQADGVNEVCRTGITTERENEGGNVLSSTVGDSCDDFLGTGGAPATKVARPLIELQDLADNGGPTETMALGLGSVARASAAANCLATDQRGLIRPATDCSSGAYQLTTRQLTVEKAGGGTGTVTSSPAGIDCGPDCASETSEFVQSPPFTTVTLTATPAPGSLFTGWSDACSGNAPSCQVGLGTARRVTATFSKPVQPGRPRLMASLFGPDKVGAGKVFSARLTVKNRVPSAARSTGSSRMNGGNPASATRLTTCLKLPPAAIAVRAKGAEVHGRKACWSKAKLAAGKKVSYTARLRLTRSAGASRKARSATLRASVTASNTTGENFQASGEKTFRITPAKPRRPKPVTG